jgi:hypothetical protein
MVSLLDVGPLTDTVKVRGKDVTLYPIAPAGLFYLIRQSEEVRLLLDGRASEIQPERLMQMGPDNIAMVVGVGAVAPEEPDWLSKVEESAKVAKTLSVTEQLSAIVKIFAMTFPEGVGPFVDALRSLTDGLDQAVTEGAGSASENKSLNGANAQVITDISQIPSGASTPRVN